MKLHFLVPILALILCSSFAFGASKGTSPLPSPLAAKFAMESLTDAQEQEMFYFLGEDLNFLLDKRYALSTTIKNSYKSPQPLYNKSVRMGGGIVFVNGHIFVDNYYKDHRGFDKTDKSTKELAEQQVWFRWNPEQQTYTKQYGGSQVALMEGVMNGKSTVTLYRGLAREEVEMLLKLQKGDISMLKRLLNFQRDSLFFTPNERSAQRWSKGYYVSMEFDQEMLKRSYVGVEFDYLEIAIYESQILIDAVKTMKVIPYEYEYTEDTPDRGISVGEGEP